MIAGKKGKTDLLHAMRKRPWNRVDSAVYSLVTRGDHANMNICSYVTPVAMQPKRYIIGVYKGTQTLLNLQTNPHGVLQILAESQYGLVRLLGKQSGRHIRKLDKLREPCMEWKGLPCLQNALAWIEFRIIGQLDAGDHIAMLAEVLAYKNQQPGSALTLRQLADRNIIRL